MTNDPELRLTVTDNIYYQQPGADPRQIEASYQRFIQTNEQIFERITFAEESWKPLDLAWITSASLVVFRNRHTRDNANKLPSRKDIDELKKHVIEIGFASTGTDPLQAAISIDPGESARFRVCDLRRVRIRSTYGKTRYTYSLIPE